MWTDRIRRPSGGLKPVVYAVLVHVLVIVVLLISFRWQSPPATLAKPDKPIVQAQAVNDAEVRKEVERLKRQEDAKRKEEAERNRRVEEAKQQAAEAEQKRKAEEARLAELKRNEAAEKQKAATAEKKRKAEEARRLEARRKQEAEQKRKEAEAAVKELLAAEEHERAQAQQVARARGEISRYEALIRQKVERNWARPPGAAENMECVVRVRLIPSGEVVQATVVRSSGDRAFDRSVENAVYKATPLPVPEDKALFDHFRELDFKFRPEAQG